MCDYSEADALNEAERIYEIQELRARLSAAEAENITMKRLSAAEAVVEVVGLYLTGHKHTSDLIAAHRRYEAEVARPLGEVLEAIRRYEEGR